MEKDLQLLLDAKFNISITGSRTICEPCPADSDWDYLVEVESSDRLSEIVSLLDSNGFHWEGATEHYQDVGNNFMSWRKDKLNFIVTKNEDFIKKHKIATYVCKRLNLLKKEDRITVFQAILYNNYYSN